MISDEIREKAYLAFGNSVRKRHGLPPMDTFPFDDDCGRADLDAALSAVLPMIVEKCAEVNDTEASHLEAQTLTLSDYIAKSLRERAAEMRGLYKDGEHDAS